MTNEEIVKHYAECTLQVLRELDKEQPSWREYLQYEKNKERFSQMLKIMMINTIEKLRREKHDKY